MFESALITRAGVEHQVDVGLLAETIFFYNSVQLVLTRSSVSALAAKIPSEDLVALLRRTELKLTYLQPSFGVVTAGPLRLHDFGAFTFGGDKERKVKDYRDEISMALERQLGKGASTRKLTATIVEKTALHRFKNSGCKEKIITDLAREDIADKKFAHSAAIAILRNLVPDFSPPADFRFEIFDTGQGYAVDTNIDFVELNKKYHRYVSPSYCTIDTGFLLAHIIDARLESYFGACYMAEIVTTPVLSDLIRLKHFDFLQRRDNNVQEIKLFQELSLPDTPTIREAINSGGRTVSEFLTLIDNAERFRSWIRTANPDAGLIRSYYLAATRQTWADKLPTKTIRFVMATGAGMLADLFLPTGIGTAAGVTLGAADSLYLDRILKGWRPSHFIDSTYRSFVATSTIHRKSA